MTRALKTRNVLLSLMGAALLVLKPRYAGPGTDVVHAYLGNLSVSFALYFAAVNATSDRKHGRLIAAALTLVAVEAFEATNGFGKMVNVYDPVDFVANAVGVGLAVAVDFGTEKLIERRISG